MTALCNGLVLLNDFDPHAGGNGVSMLPFTIVSSPHELKRLRQQLRWEYDLLHLVASPEGAFLLYGIVN